MMTVARYFLFVGGALLALLFAVDAFAPKASADNTIRSTAGVDKSTLRIRSEQKWPERVVLDTNQPTIVPQATTEQIAVASPEPAAEISAKARVRETFSQFVPLEPKADAPAPRKRKIAKSRPSQPVLRLAQQQRFGFFGTSTW